MQLPIAVAAFVVFLGTSAWAQNLSPRPPLQRHAAAGRLISGTIRRIDGLLLTIVTRTGRAIAVDDAEAWRLHRSAVPVLGRSVVVRGSFDGSGVLRAVTVSRLKDSPALWPADR